MDQFGNLLHHFVTLEILVLKNNAIIKQTLPFSIGVLNSVIVYVSGYVSTYI